MNKVILIFLDGVGIGENNPEENPFAENRFKFLNKFFGTFPVREHSVLKSENAYVFPSDATLDFAGLPQSGTGQTAILCGVNAAQIAGKHFGPFPHSTLFSVLKEKNIYTELKRRGLSGAFANAYPPKFFEYLARGHTRLAATTKAAIFAGIKLNDLNALNEGRALSHEIDNSRWKTKLNLPVETITPRRAAENLLRLSEKYDFVFYEYFFTDHWGHGRNLDFYESGIKTLDEFLTSVIENSLENRTLLICSDHGNFENLAVKTHTRNPAFTLSAGYGAGFLFEKIKTIADIKDAVLELLAQK